MFFRNITLFRFPVSLDIGTLDAGAVAVAVLFEALADDWKEADTATMEASS